MDITGRKFDKSSLDGSEINMEGSSGQLGSLDGVPSTKISLTNRQRMALYIICYVNFLNYMDRFTIAGLLTQIQCEYEISDSEAGLISTVFVVAHMLCAPAFGYWGDRHSRKLLMCGGIFLWGLATLAGSFMPNYWSFLVARIFVGMGEAMFSTVAPTLIADLCVGDTRSNFLIVFFFAIPVGSGLGFIVGSSVANAFGDWRWGMRVTPILGLIGLVLVILVVKEPPRGLSEGSHLKTTTYWDDIKYLFTNKSYVTSLIGITLASYFSGGIAWWGPKYFSLGIATFQGEENLNIDNVSFMFGLTATIAGIIGVWAGSFIGQKLRVRFPTADALVCAWGMIASAPLFFWASMAAAGSQWAFYTIITWAEVLMNLVWAPSADLILYVIVPTRRATAEAVLILLSHAFGDASSPYIIGLISDAFKSSLTTQQKKHTFKSIAAYLNENTTDCSISSTINFETLDVEYRSLQYSLLITILFQVVGAFFFFIAAWYVVSDKAKVSKAVASFNRKASVIDEPRQ